MRLLSILITLGCLLGSSSIANASEIAVVVIGDTAVRERVSTQLEDWLRIHGHTPIDSTLPVDVTTTLLGCVARSDEPCARALLDKHGSLASVLVAKAEVRTTKDGIADVELTAYWFRKGRDTVAERRFCERCTDQVLRESSDDLLSALVAGDPITTAHLTLTSAPSGATVLIDGAAIGATPITYELAAGRHRLTVSAPDHEVDTREIAVVAGDTTRIDVPLVGTRDAPPPGAPGSPAAAISLVVVGGAAIVGGIICVAADQDAGPDSPRRIRDTAPLGVTLLATGAASAAVGAYLWFHHRAAASSPVAAIGHDGGFIGWAGRF
ncbi:hypothetical protein BH11MYX2_BH11MYX2_07350 [soil metagenome]